jgi:hypothetical protein
MLATSHKHNASDLGGQDEGIMGASSDGVIVIEDGGILIEKTVPIPPDGHVVYCNGRTAKVLFPRLFTP